MAIFTDKDKGWKDFVNQFSANAGKTTAFVGYLRSSGDHKKNGDEESLKGDSITVAMVAAINELGSSDGKTPERSFIRSALLEHERELEVMLKKLSKLVMDKKMSKKQALGLVAEQVITWVKHKIDSNIPPPNAPSTVARKGSDHTLIDTAQMRNSLDWEIREDSKRKNE